MDLSVLSKDQSVSVDMEIGRTILEARSESLGQLMIPCLLGSLMVAEAVVEEVGREVSTARHRSPGTSGV